MSKHLIIASWDGITTHFCGVGSIVRNTILALQEIVESEKIKISLAYIAADKKGKVFNPVCFQESSELVQKTGGYLIPICNGTGGLDEWDMWQSFPQWESVCASLATSLNIILANDDYNILMLHDTPFLPFSKYKGQMFDNKLKSFYLPHSSGLNNSFGDEDWRRERIKLEKDCFSFIADDENSFVLANGESFARHLIKDYELSFSNKNYLKNGLYFNQYKIFREKKFSNKQLKQFNIDIADNYKIIFCWGRCSPVKGIKELIDAWKEIETELPNHYLILQTPNNSGEDEYFQNLKNKLEIIPRTILIDDFNPDIWKTVLRCVNTDIVCIPSLSDSNSLTAMEAKLFCNGINYIIVASEIDGIKDTFTDDQCFKVNPLDNDIFSQTILKAAKTSNGNRKKMADSNLQSLYNFDYSMNFKKFLKNFNFI